MRSSPMDKRRYVSRNPNVERPIHKIGDETGSPEKDGYTVRDRAGYRPKRNRYFDDSCLPESLMDESEARWARLPTSIYDED
ncbi:hypothetical protein [Pseudohoeflea coraliihabitans]|uniref:Uncharacterized protein n=1 Tax=Pseudohoeflea coraliihabitans TaxID=2860393 RepID=A0ABS6WVY0_9HYPH|nr:hypothetical protein [Pseudohoeflea sp. DP4N28-3]MBW3099254.1 hypothetical protein [Pseudohoeflea sp. DP4N28-3]